MKKKIQYVVGFMFTEDTTQVLLIRKTRPNWQAGFLNGIGGHIEEGEDKLDAMRREFWEETGEPSPEMWEHTITLESPDFIVYYMRVFDSYIIEQVMARKSFPTDETPELWPVNVDPEQLVSACSWAIPMSVSNHGIRFPVYVPDLNLQGDDIGHRHCVQYFTQVSGKITS